ncbi:hypothetical protein BDV93DRAFT_562273 [Ceratobasidium sp. AG-I]|nr:hypothetical protein BDV93DRAFT_562273 [Ceratobasidium sp. AG-I]
MALEMVDGKPPIRYDCVWVTIGRLLGIEMDELVARLPALQLPQAGTPGGMNADSIVTMLGSHNIGFGYQWLEFPNTLLQAKEHAQYIAGQLGVTKAGIAYSRKHGASGHCDFYDAQKAEGLEGMLGHEEHPLDRSIQPGAAGLGEDEMYQCAPYLVFAIKEAAEITGRMEFE